MTAIGLQLAMEITRQFDMAIRWSVEAENNMVSIQRLLELAKLQPESLSIEDSSNRGGHHFGTSI